MKRNLIASMLLVSLFVAPASFASNDSDQKASEASEFSVLAAASIPVCVCAVAESVGSTGSDAVAGSGHRLIKLVDAAGDGLGDLTWSGIKQMEHLHNAVRETVIGSNHDSRTPHMSVDKKEIPLIVRPDYVELNEKVKLK